MTWVKRKMNRTVRKTVGLLARISRGRIINIDSGDKGTASVLSNFTKSPFVLDGVKWESFEGFWQGIKFPEGSKERIKAQTLSGVSAKKLSVGIQANNLFYGGKKIEYGSKELYELAKRAERARFQQNPEQLHTLLSTGNAKFIHFVGLEDSRSLPRRTFCRILTELRDEFRAAHKVRQKELIK